MSSHPLLQEITENPDDIDARLVYADFLAESGNPRGDFISGQIQLQGMTGLESEYPSIYASTERLKARHKSQWIDQLVETAFTDDIELREQQRFVLQDRGEFEGGFLERLWLTPNQLSQYWDEILRCEPVAGVALVVDEDAPADLEAARTWRKLRLHREGWFAGPILARILNWPLDHLQQLDCSGCDLGNLGARLLAGHETVLPENEWPRVEFDLGQLTALGLQRTNILDDEFQLIINANEFTSLRVLDIRDCRLNDDATFRAIRKLNALEDLRFSASHFPQPLVGWEGVGRFTHWELPSAITAGQVAELFPRPSSRLRSLSGVGPTVLPQHPRVLAECAEALTDICLSVSNMGTEKFQILVAAESMKTLRRLHAFSCSLDDEAVGTLIASGPQSLVELDLCYNDLTSKSVVELANWKGIEHVVFLNLSANRPFNHDAYRALLESPYLDPVKLELGPIDDDKIADALVDRFGDGVKFGRG